MTIREGQHEVIPQADTRLAPHARVTVAPEAEDPCEALRAGLAPGHTIDASA